MFKKEVQQHPKHAFSSRDEQERETNSRSRYDFNERPTMKNFETSHERSHEEYFGVIKFNPGYYDLTRRIYKDSKIKLKAQKYLPKFNLGFKILKKMRNALAASQNKQAYIFGNSMKIILDEESRLSNVLLLDEISYAVDDKYEDKFYSHQIYPIKLFMIGDEAELIHLSPIEDFKQSLIPFFKTSETGILNFNGLDCSIQTAYEKISHGSSPNPFYDCEMLSSVRPIDLIYLNCFRIAVFAFPDGNDPEAIRLRKYVYFPPIDFSVQQIRQPFKLVSTPLTKMLAPQKHVKTNSSTTSTITSLSGGHTSNGNSSSEGGRKRISIKFGFVTLDQNQRICPLMASDPMSQRVPLIGVWLSGVQLKRETKESYDNGVACDENYLIWSIMTEFVRSGNIAQRFSYDKQKKSFLLILFSTEENPQFYEVDILSKEDAKAKTSSYRLLRSSENISYEEERNLHFEYKEELFLPSFTQDLASNKKRKKSFTIPKTSSKSNKKHAPSNILNIEEESLQELREDIDTLVNKMAPPKPQSKPKLEESGSTYKTASFINNSFCTGLPQELQGDFKINPLAEKLFMQQAEQLKFLQNQVMELQSALLSAHSLNPSMNNSKNSFRHSPSVQKELRSYYREQSHSKTLKRENNVSDFKGTNKNALKNLSGSDEENESLVFPEYNLARPSFSPRFEKSRFQEKSLVSKGTNTTFCTLQEGKLLEGDLNKENVQPNTKEHRITGKTALTNKYLSETQESSDPGFESNNKNIFKGIEINPSKTKGKKHSDSSIEAVGFNDVRSLMSSSKFTATPSALKSKKIEFCTEDFSPPAEDIRRGFFMGREELENVGIRPNNTRDREPFSNANDCSPDNSYCFSRNIERSATHLSQSSRKDFSEVSELTLKKFDEAKYKVNIQDVPKPFEEKGVSYEKTLRRSPSGKYPESSSKTENGAWKPFKNPEEPTFQYTKDPEFVDPNERKSFKNSKDATITRYQENALQGEISPEYNKAGNSLNKELADSGQKEKFWRNQSLTSLQKQFEAPETAGETYLAAASLSLAKEKSQANDLRRNQPEHFKSSSLQEFPSTKHIPIENNENFLEISKRNFSQLVINENEETIGFAKDFVEKHLSLSRSFLNSLSTNEINSREGAKYGADYSQRRVDSPVKGKEPACENAMRSSLSFPRIKYDFKRKDCDSSDEDEQVRKLEAKYLKGLK